MVVSFRPYRWNVEQARHTCESGCNRQNLGGVVGRFHVIAAKYNGRAPIVVPKRAGRPGELDEELKQLPGDGSRRKGEAGHEPQGCASRRAVGAGEISRLRRKVVRSCWLGIFFRDIVAGFAPWTAYPAQEGRASRSSLWLTLALGIGATSAIFSVVNAVLLRPLAMEDPSHVVFVQETWRNIFPWRRRRATSSISKGRAPLSRNFALRMTPASILKLGNSLSASTAKIATANYFTTFGVQPISGRVFSADEDKAWASRTWLSSANGSGARSVHSDPSIVRPADTHIRPAHHGARRHAQELRSSTKQQ